MMFFGGFTNGRVGWALFVLRLVIGAAFIIHGSQKISNPFHWLDAGPLPGTPSWLEAVVALVEFGGGGCLVLGLLTPLAALLIGCDMAVVIFAVSIPRGATFVGTRGHSFELPALYLCAMIAFLLSGPGAYAVDAVIVPKVVSPRTGR